MDKPLINRIASSNLITLKLEEYFPAEEFAVFDLKDYLFHGLILKEKDFRKSIKEFDWQSYKGKILLVYRSTDAIIPVWAYMLVAANAAPFAISIFHGTKEEYLVMHYRNIIKKMDLKQYEGQRIVIKGCSDKEVPAAAYLEITNALYPYAQSIMYGEPCSTVPVFKRPRKIEK